MQKQKLYVIIDNLLEIFENFLNYDHKDRVDDTGLNGIVRMLHLHSSEVFNSVKNYREKLNFEDKNLQKEYDEKFYNIQKRIFEHYKEFNKDSQVFTERNGKEANFHLVSEEKYNRLYYFKGLDNFVSEAVEKNDIEQFNDLTLVQAQHLSQK